LEKHLGSVRSIEEQSVLERVLSEFLNLLLWKFRHQLFGIWTASQIAEVVGYNRMRFYPVEGALHFRFTDTHLASVCCEPRLHLYAELRTTAKTLFGKGRINSIQPDWRLVGEPITDQSSQLLIIECKQYAKPNTKNFLEAAVDYAANAGRAQVVLVNYGPMDEGRIRARVPARAVADGSRSDNSDRGLQAR
jgi:hypothetical protein